MKINFLIFSPYEFRATDKSREHEFGDILEKVAEQIYKNAEINSLGRELGFQPPEITTLHTNERKIPNRHIHGNT